MIPKFIRHMETDAEAWGCMPFVIRDLVEADRDNPGKQASAAIADALSRLLGSKDPEWEGRAMEAARALRNYVRFFVVKEGECTRTDWQFVERIAAMEFARPQ